MVKSTLLGFFVYQCEDYLLWIDHGVVILYIICNVYIIIAEISIHITKKNNKKVKYRHVVKSAIMALF